MKLLANIFAGLVALEHIYILVLEMFMWTSDRATSTFGFTTEFAEMTKTLAANQGLYNGFLAAGLLVGIFAPNATVGYAFKIFFLLCVLVAAIFGGMTVAPRIILVQGAPALLALIFVWLSNRS